MKQFTLLLLALFNLLACKSITAQVQFNGNLENINPLTKLPLGWSYNKSAEKFYDVKLDSIVKQEGKYSVSINQKSDGAQFTSVSFYIPKTFKGSEIELKGYIKTENVKEGFAGFWLRIDGEEHKVLAFDNMQNQNVHGTTGWTAYSIKLPYYNEKATNIVGGALLVGSGKMWFDNMQLSIDGQPIEKSEILVVASAKASLDTAFSSGSGINNIKMNAQQINNLTLLGQVWGFVKYYHPEVAKGNVNMDAELFRVMPNVIKANNNISLSTALEQWLDKLGIPEPCKSCKGYTGNDVRLSPDYGHIFDKTVLSQSLTNKLIYILNSSKADKNFYINMAGVGNPTFSNEKGYGSMFYPDAGYRLLCLFRYWNMVQYFFPYKNLIGENWNKLLPEFIPKFIYDLDAQSYTLTTLAMISRIHDTHANIWGYRNELESYRGKFTPPFQAKFIEDELVITGFYNDTLDVKEKFKIGDVIKAINGVKVDRLIKKFLPVTAASNYPTQLRDMPRIYLLQSNIQHFDFSVNRDGKNLTVGINGLKHSNVNYALDYNPYPNIPGYYLIDNKIGYLYPAKYHNKDLPDIEKLFKNTKGIIIDMRCYPSEFMPFTFVPYVKIGDAPFVKFTKGSVTQPGLFTITSPLDTKPDNDYKGKVVVIVNAQTQSQAEYTTMAFQSSSNVTVIGSTTAGADGNVSSIVLPGGISTMFSGLGILYPDETQTQRTGVKIDIEIKPTIKGIKAGRDELLEKAKQIITD